MDVLSCRPNILFLIWVRNQNIHYLLNNKLRRPIYRIKLINALTTIKNGIYIGEHFKIWKLNGQRHRDEGPTYIGEISKNNPNGTHYAYYKNGERHREDGPAIIQGISIDNPNGTYHAYYRNGEKHREDGPAWIDGISNDNPNGTSHEYYKNGIQVEPF
jgi:antitoxin component YwqK of YwqJK toxin-antitoxin module